MKLFGWDFAVCREKSLKICVYKYKNFPIQYFYFIYTFLYIIIFILYIEKEGGELYFYLYNINSKKNIEYN